MQSFRLGACSQANLSASCSRTGRFSSVTSLRSVGSIQPAVPRQTVVVRAESAESTPKPVDETPEEVFLEGSGAPAELAISVALGFFVLFLPLTIQSIGRRLWIKYKFTNKRVTVTTDSPALKRTIQIEYSKIKEIRTVPRAFGLWGDCVIFLKDGSRLEIIGLEKFREVEQYVQGYITNY